MHTQIQRLTHTLHTGPYEVAVGFVDVGTAFWFVVYVAAILQGFRFKTYSVPIVAVCANFSWEILAAFVTVAPIPLWHWGDIVWMCLDAAIVWTVLRYGRQRQTIPELRHWFYPVVAGTFIVALATQWGLEVAIGDAYGFIDAYLIAVMMSALFFFMYFERRSADAYSYTIAWCKLLGNGLTTIGFVVLYPLLYEGASRTPLLYTLCAACVVLDAGYVVLLAKARAVADSSRSPSTAHVSVPPQAA